MADGRLLNLVDEAYELTDPHPDIHELFILFDQQFFWGTLCSKACTVEWSKRMTSCAGVCEFKGKIGLCCIRLSEPLLKLRKRKDLVETLLHEMIHAYLFITGGMNFMDRDGHGPEFQSHMSRINKLAGTSISIYHSFRDEVAHYKQHWWRCTGPCRERGPYYGWVKRATNRAPGPSDIWWNGHKMNCNGTYVKVKEPEKITNGKLSKSKSDPQLPSTSGVKASNSSSSDDSNKQTTSGIGKTGSKRKTVVVNVDPKQPKIDQIFPGKGHVLVDGNASQNNDDIFIVAEVKRPQFDQIDNKPNIFPGQGLKAFRNHIIIIHTQ